jgi:glutamyl-tRNA reductase
MKEFEVSKYDHFYLISINHALADVAVRERFALSTETSQALMADFRENYGEGMMILSTCNRTEIYAFASCPRGIMELFCKHTGTSMADLNKYHLLKKNRAAIEHLFRVGSGLESKILGDFEIIGQIKKAFKESKQAHTHNAFLDRLVSNTVQCSKRVKNETALSTGAASVAFAAVLQVKDHLPKCPKNPKLVLYGMGKMGRTTCENLVNQTGLNNITLINRTEEKALRLAERYALQHADLEHLDEHLDEADIVIVATGASSATVRSEQFKTNKDRLILDLSMPRNVEHRLYGEASFKVVDVDHLSEVAEESIRNRQAQIPLAEEIIESQLNEFFDWLETRRVAPTLQAMRAKMESWKERELRNLQKKFPQMSANEAEALASQMINRITGQFARQLKNGDNLNNDLRTIHHIFEL